MSIFNSAGYVFYEHLVMLVVMGVACGLAVTNVACYVGSHMAYYVGSHGRGLWVGSHKRGLLCWQSRGLLCWRS